jgi:NADPH2:quinone reductase
MATTPHIVGYQAAGIVQEVGEGVVSFTPGQRVVATMPYGSHASMASVPARAAYAVPENMDLVQAACVPIAFGTADDCLFEFGHLKAGETVLIQAAAGGVGLAAVQLAKRAGARVLGTASTDEKLARLKQYGLDTGINYKSADLVASVMAASGGRGVDLVVDSVGGHTLEGSIACLAYRGRVCWVGNAGREAYSPGVWGLMQKNALLNGIYLGAEFNERPERTRNMIERLLADCASGALKVVVDRTFPLSEAAAAHTYIEGREAFGRVVLVPEH